MGRLKGGKIIAPPSQDGVYSNAQLAALWVRCGGPANVATLMAAIAVQGESGGRLSAINYDPNGTVDRGLWQINSIWGFDANRLLTDAVYSTQAAVHVFKTQGLEAWKGDKVYDAYVSNGGVVPQPAGGVNVDNSSSGSGSSTTPVSLLGDVAGGAGDALDVLKDLLTGNFTDLGRLAALAFITVVKDVAIGFVDLVVAPGWHWNQRAVAWYSERILFTATPFEKLSALVIPGIAEPEGPAWAIPWTAAFWGLGYALLWTSPDKGLSFKPVPVKASRLHAHVRAAQMLPARRSLVRPRNVEEKTPTKPKPHSSSATLTHVTTLTTNRTRTVKVTHDSSGFDSVSDSGRTASIPPAQSETGGETSGQAVAGVREVGTIAEPSSEARRRAPGSGRRTPARPTEQGASVHGNQP